MRSWEGNLLHKVVRKHLNQRLVAVGVKLRHVHKLGFIVAVISTLFANGKFEVQSYRTGQLLEGESGECR